jgi:two-component sensor histidine kinase
VKDFVALVDGRIHALARAHNQITDDHWGPAPLRALIDAEARAFIEPKERIIVSGEPVMLNPQAFSTMALVLHELITNSTKYGSLSGEGQVSISWDRNDAGDLVLTWRERNGPPVVPPTRKGFGTTIIGKSVPYDLGGSATVDYAPGGLTGLFRIPARHVSEQPKTIAGAPIRFPRPAYGHPTEPPERMLTGLDVLLVEDSLIIALDAEDVLQRLGAESIFTASTVEAALDAIDENRPSIAMLDINLGDRNSFPVADRLLQLGIPFLFATGYGEQAQLPMEHRNQIIVQKPYTLENVARAVNVIIGTAAVEG